MTKIVFTNESLNTFVDKIKAYIDGIASAKADKNHTHSLSKSEVTTALGYTPPTENTDTKVTNTLATTTKAYVTGTTSKTTNTGTQVFDTGIYLDTTAGRLCVNSLVIGGKVLLTYNANDACLDVSFL